MRWHSVCPMNPDGRLSERFDTMLRELLTEHLVIDRSVCYIANVVKCRPPAIELELAGRW